ncbi:membrane transport protein-domain-containing protein [Russula earlei]|uniref:Membrane transport protein-domain-containing protein n=1 Tax=Russula earlei TaxID=71964 RepID=A0ACC0U8L4_9AGAM|nr:membrane transport protein-domain-containing protein [Russula earlei]
MSSTPIWPLLGTVLGSIIQVILVCVAGYALALRGFIDKKIQRQLNVINVNFFTPCLLFSKVAFTLSSEKFLQLWIIPLFFFFLSGVSLIVARQLGLLFGLSRPHRHFAMAASMIMNSNTLPVALLQSLAFSVPGLEWGHDDTTDAIVGRALTYLLLCGTMGQFIRWSYGVHLLSKAISPDEIESREREDETCPLTSDIEDIRHELDDGRDQLNLNNAWRNENHRDLEQYVYALPPYPLVPPVSYPADPEANPMSNFDEISEGGDVPVLTRSHLRTFAQRVLCAGARLRRSTIWRSMANFMTPPLWASVISLVVVLNQPLQHFIDGYMWPVRGAITQAGGCSIPLTLVVLGAYFHRPPDEAELQLPDTPGQQQQVTLTSRLRTIFCLDRRDNWKGPNRRESGALRLGSPGEGMAIFVTILARMFVVPLLLLPLVVLGAVWGTPGVFKDPVFILSQVLLIASPPAVTLAQITGVTSDSLERLISRTLFWSYCLVAPPLIVGYVMTAMFITRL